MTLKAKVEKIDDIAEEHRPLYAEENGVFVLQVEGAVSADRLKEFRDNNIRLLKERDELKTEMDKIKQEIDIEEYKTLREEAQKAKEKKMIEAGDMERLLSERIENLKREYDARQAKLSAVAKEKEETATKFQAMYESMVLDQSVTQVALKQGALEHALDDILSRTKRVFRLESEAPVARLANGEYVYGKSGAPLTLDEFMIDLASEKAPHLFKQASGSGATGSNVASWTLNVNDQVGIGRHLEDVAKGRVRVVA